MKINLFWKLINLTIYPTENWTTNIFPIVKIQKQLFLNTFSKFEFIIMNFIEKLMDLKIYLTLKIEKTNYRCTFSLFQFLNIFIWSNDFLTNWSIFRHRIINKNKEWILIIIFSHVPFFLYWFSSSPVSWSEESGYGQSYLSTVTSP